MQATSKKAAAPDPAPTPHAPPPAASAEPVAPPQPRPVPLDLAQAPPGARPCAMASALVVVGERWSLLALRELSYGVHRFSRIVGYTGAPRDILADRLRKLEAAGLVERRPYSERPPRHEYHLTQAGRELFPVLTTLLAWGSKWAVDAPKVVFRHSCGAPVDVELACRHCGEPVTRDTLTPTRGAPVAPVPQP
jgi:DNA-binding HxlR family transcriptional regulator